ncbi:MAG: MMPL family transporter [Nitrospirae bacterium]|nr:MMPL family transporter [Nitrospirota bacterium]
MLQKHIQRIVRFPVTIILLTIFATLFFGYQFKSLFMVLDPKALLPQEHPYVKLNNEIEKQFGGSRVVLIGLASKDGDIFNPSDIEKIRRINEEVKKIPGILENNVVSIADKKVKYVKAEGNSLDIKGVLEGIEYTDEGMKELKERVYSNPAFINSLVSADGKVAAIILDFKGGASDWQQKAGGEQKTEVRSQKQEVSSNQSEVRSKKQEVRNDEAEGGRLKAEVRNEKQETSSTHGGGSLSFFPSPLTGEGKGGGGLVASAYAQEDWKKWQKGGGAEQKQEAGKQEAEGGRLKAEAGSKKQEGGNTETPSSPSTGEGTTPQTPSPSTGEGTTSQIPSPSTGEGKGGGEQGKWPAGGGEGGWGGAGGGEANWEQWYVSDSTIHKKILEIVDKYKDANTDIYVGGLPIALSFLEADSLRMTKYVYPLALIVIMIVLYFAFQSIQGMILPIVCALLSVVWAVGLMGVFKIALDPWNMMTPILILAVAAGHSVQILKRYYEELGNAPLTHPSPHWGEGKGEGERGGEDDRHWGVIASRKAVVDSLSKIGPVMITAGLVAAASFASLVTFKLKTFQSFGIFTAFGILSALILEMTFIPAARSLMKPPKRQLAVSSKQLAGTPSPLTGEGRGGGGLLDRFMLSISRLVTHRSGFVWVGLLVVIAFSVYGIEHLTIINSLKGLFFESTQFRKDDAALNKSFGGTATFYVYLEGDKEDSLKNPEVLRAIESLQKEIESVPEVGKTQSFVDYVKSMNQSMHGGDPAYRVIPADQQTISEYLFLFTISGSQGEMDRFLDYQYQKSVIWVFLRDDSTVLGQRLIDIVNKYGGGVEARSKKQEVRKDEAEGGRLKAEVRNEKAEVRSKTQETTVPSPLAGEGQGGGDRFPPGIKVGVAGSIPVMMALNQTMVAGKIWNILQIAGIVFVISAIVLRSVIGGILVLLPLGVAVLVNFGVLGIAGIGLGVGTAAISAMAVGFGADYSIYMVYRLREEARSKKQEEKEEKSEVRSQKQEARSKKEDIDEAIKRTLLTAGKAIVFVAAAMSVGGITLLFTGYYLHMEGFLVPLAMFTSSLSTLIVLPAVVALVRPRFIYR